MFRLYYRRVLGVFYVLLSFIYTIYRMGSGLTIGDIFVSISLMVLGVYLLKYRIKKIPKDNIKK
ncbi:MAG: hypothetical protein ACJ0GV_00395 [Dehalococcoidia bacterium]|tara:strand:- start:183 stop:374 length:192 start_codon:yes stop_codon:yes gene_type:complete